MILSILRTQAVKAGEMHGMCMVGLDNAFLCSRLLFRDSSMTQYVIFISIAAL